MVERDLPSGPTRDRDPREGAGEVLPALCERYRPRLLAYVGRILSDPHEAEDVVQEVFLRASAALRDLRSASGWLHAVSYRLAVDRMRARARRTRVQEAHAPREASDAGESDLERLEEAARVRRALARLDEPYRTALRLRYLEGLEFSEVAARMSAPERTARTWVGRGLARLRERLGGNEA